MPIIGDNNDDPREAVDETAVAQIIENDIIEEYTKYASTIAPGFETFHALLAITGINHRIAQKGVEIPRTSSPRLFVLAIAPTRSGKTLSVRIAQRSIFTKIPVEHISTATPEGLADLLSKSLNAPVLVIDEIGHSLSTGYSRIDHFLLRAYDGESWQHIVRNNAIYVPAEKMRLSVVGMTTPTALSKAQQMQQYALVGLFARFIMVSGRKARRPDFIPYNLEFGVALSRIVSRVERNAKIPFEDNDAKEAHDSITEDILSSFTDEDLIAFYAGADEYLVKIATAFAVARESTAISSDDLERARKLVRECIMGTMDYMAELAKTSTRASEIAILADRIYSKVSREGGRALRSKILRDLHIKAALAREAERVLQDEERLATVTAVKPAFYCIPNTKVECSKCEYKRVCPLGGVTRFSP